MSSSLTPSAPYPVNFQFKFLGQRWRFLKKDIEKNPLENKNIFRRANMEQVRMEIEKKALTKELYGPDLLSEIMPYMKENVMGCDPPPTLCSPRSSIGNNGHRSKGPQIIDLANEEERVFGRGGLGLGVEGGGYIGDEYGRSSSSSSSNNNDNTNDNNNATYNSMKPKPPKKQKQVRLVVDGDGMGVYDVVTPDFTIAGGGSRSGTSNYNNSSYSSNSESLVLRPINQIQVVNNDDDLLAATSDKTEDSISRLEFKASIDALCKRQSMPVWDSKDTDELIKFIDPGGDMDVSLLEAELAFKNYRLPPDSDLESASLLMARLDGYMKKRQIRVADLFRSSSSIDPDGNISIPLHELHQSLIRIIADSDRNQPNQPNQPSGGLSNDNDPYDKALTKDDINILMKYFNTCCREDNATAVSLSELQAAFRRYKVLKTNKSKVAYCKGLMEKLSDLLSKLSMVEWFRTVNTLDVSKGRRFKADNNTIGKKTSSLLEDSSTFAEDIEQPETINSNNNINNSISNVSSNKDYSRNNKGSNDRSRESYQNVTVPRLDLAVGGNNSSSTATATATNNIPIQVTHDGGIFCAPETEEEVKVVQSLSFSAASKHRPAALVEVEDEADQASNMERFNLMMSIKNIRAVFHDKNTNLIEHSNTFNIPIAESPRYAHPSAPSGQKRSKSAALSSSSSSAHPRGGRSNNSMAGACSAKNSPRMIVADFESRASAITSEAGKVPASQLRQSDGKYITQDELEDLEILKSLNKLKKELVKFDVAKAFKIYTMEKRLRVPEFLKHIKVATHRQAAQGGHAVVDHAHIGGNSSSNNNYIRHPNFNLEQSSSPRGGGGPNGKTHKNTFIKLLDRQKQQQN